jgi:nitrate reductase NapE component
MVTTRKGKQKSSDKSVDLSDQPSMADLVENGTLAKLEYLDPIDLLDEAHTTAHPETVTTKEPEVSLYNRISNVISLTPAPVREKASQLWEFSDDVPTDKLFRLLAIALVGGIGFQVAMFFSAIVNFLLYCFIFGLFALITCKLFIAAWTNIKTNLRDVA